MNGRIGNCEWCAKSYTYKRSTKKFCSTACRVQFHKHGDRMMHLIEQVNDNFELMHLLIDLKSRALLNPKFLEATAHIVIESTNLDQHLLKATAKGISQEMLIDYHK